jgi:hypothetical protein
VRQQANQLPEPTVLRLIDLLAVAVEDTRQGADPRLPLELALVKATRPHSDLSRESLAHRVELLEARAPSGGAHPPAQSPAPAAVARSEPVEPVDTPSSAERSDAPHVELDQVTEAWDRTILDAVRERSIPVAKVAEPQNIGVLREALYEVTGRKLAVVLESREAGNDEAIADDDPLSEEDVFSLLKETFNAEEVKEEPDE